MNLLQRLFVSTLLLFAAGSSCVYGQGSQRVSTAIGNVNSVARILAYAQIKVCTYDSAHPSTCSTTVTLYQDPALTIPYTSNPIQADKNGNYSYWVTAGNYVEQMCATGAQCQTQVITLGGSGSGANLPHVTQVISGDDTGNGVGMPEKGTNIVADQAFVAWDEDTSMGRFDCRDTKYAGGCLGSTPQLAMQALVDDMVCYQSIVGKHATTLLPPGLISVGTPANPILVFPSGSYVRGVGGEGGANNPSGTVLRSTYNNYDVVDVNVNTTATCSDGNVHTNPLTQGSYERFTALGCATGGCTNLPGDTNTWFFGGPANVGIRLYDSGYWADQLMSIATGSDGIIINGLDSRIGKLFAYSHNSYFNFGIDQSGQNYQFSSGEVHGGIVLNNGDGIFTGPFEDYGTVITPGYEYGHIFGVIWGGGSSQLGPIFSQRDEIGLFRPFGQIGGRTHGGRIDGSLGDGIWALGGDTYSDYTITSSCTVDGNNSYYVGSVALATAGSGQTDGTYLLTASSGVSQISVTVSGGIATAAVVTVHGRGYTSTPPTFTLTAGGTPATFTVAMQKLFATASGGVADQGACDYVREEGAGTDIWNGLVAMQSIPTFGASHSTGDFYGSSDATWNTPEGNGPNQRPIWDQIPSDYIGQGQRMVLPDQNIVNGGASVTGTVINLYVTGTHIRMSNTSPTTITAINNAIMMQDVWIFGDGSTTFPSALVHSCSGHDLLVNNNQWYHLFVSNGEFFSAPILTEQCDPPNDDWTQHGFFGQTPPTITTLATNDTFGSYAVRAIPALGNGTLAAVGSGSAFSYCFITEVWVGGGKQTNAPICNSKTPPVTPGPSTSLTYHVAIPINWTRYRLIFQSTTDGSFTASLGTMLDVSTTSAPMAGIADTAFAITTGVLTGDAVNIPTANQSINMTGTYNFDSSNLPTSSTTLGIPGQVKIDPTVSTGAMYYCTSEDHWVKVPLTWATF